MHERHGAGIHGGERVGLPDGLRGRSRTVGPRQDPQVGRSGFPRAGAARRVHDQQVAGCIVRDPIGHAPEPEPGRLSHAAVADDDQVGVVLDRCRQDRFTGCPLDQLRGRVYLLRSRGLRGLVQGGLQRLARDAVGVQRADEHQLAAEAFRELLRNLDGDGRGRGTVGTDDDRSVGHQAASSVPFICGWTSQRK